MSLGYLKFIGKELTILSSDDTCLFPLPLREAALQIRYASSLPLIESVSVYGYGISQPTTSAGKQLSDLLSKQRSNLPTGSRY